MYTVHTQEISCSVRLKYVGFISFNQSGFSFFSGGGRSARADIIVYPEMFATKSNLHVRVWYNIII